MEPEIAAREYVDKLISPADRMVTANAINQGNSQDDKDNRAILGLGPNDPPLTAAQLKTKIEAIQIAAKNPQGDNAYTAAVKAAAGAELTRQLLSTPQDSLAVTAGIPTSVAQSIEKKSEQDAPSLWQNLGTLAKFISNETNTNPEREPQAGRVIVAQAQRTTTPKPEQHNVLQASATIPAPTVLKKPGF